MITRLLKGTWMLVSHYLPMYLWAFIKRPATPVWLISERPTDARDNGFVLFKWIREHHPEQRVIYAIHKSAPDYANVKDLGEVVEYGSYRHWYFYFAAKICADTSWSLCCPCSMSYLMMRNILPPRSKRVFLQHGITKDFMRQGRKKILNADVFVCGAYPEWEYISKGWGYENDEVKYLGFARFDRLVDKSNNYRQVLFMPTWRLSLSNVKDLTDSDYYKHIQAFLTHPELERFLEKENLELIYFLHPAIRQHKHFFENFANGHIRVLNNEDDDMQRYICSAKLLITDFSSIYFDFAYQRKPVIYFHFDYDDYRKEHYQEGYFSYERDGFGPIAKSEDELMAALKDAAANDWRMSDIYAQRTERFFPLHDFLNCQRHYDTFKQLVNP